jgi:hypothetical protein
MDHLLDPQMAEWLRQKKAELAAAAESDASAQEDANRTALLGQFAQSYVNKKPTAVAPRQVQDARSRFGAEYGLEKDARGYAADALKAQGKPPDPDDGPPPPEWGAPASIATRKEARSMGYGPRAPETQDPMKAPPSEQLRAELRRNGHNPDIYPTTGAALSALSPRALIPEQIVVGSGGELVRVPTRGPDRTAKPVLAPGGGGPLRKDKDLPPGAGEKLTEIATEARNFEALLGGFRDEFAGMGLTGGVQTGLAKKLGAAGTANQQALGEWWKNFDRLINLPQRNQMFGASLTPGEKASWAEAQNISPNSDPKIVRRAFQNLLRIVRAKVEGRGRSLIADGFSPDVIREATLGVVGGESAPAGGGGGDAPPVAGAIKTKSGRWAVKNASGQWEYVQ